jgi:hypothetical protein
MLVKLRNLTRDADICRKVLSGRSYGNVGGEYGWYPERVRQTTYRVCKLAARQYKKENTESPEWTTRMGIASLREHSAEIMDLVVRAEVEAV